MESSIAQSIHKVFNKALGHIEKTIEINGLSLGLIANGTKRDDLTRLLFRSWQYIDGKPADASRQNDEDTTGHFHPFKVVQGFDRDPANQPSPTQWVLIFLMTDDQPSIFTESMALKSPVDQFPTAYPPRRDALDR